MLSDRVRRVMPSLTLAISAKAKEMKKSGVDVVGFGAGEPDFNTPDNIKNAGIKAIEENITRYTPASGTPELKDAIAEKFKRDNNLNYTRENIAASIGAKHALYNVFMSILNPGDEVIIFSPYWVSYVEQVKLAGGVPVIVELNKAGGFSIDFELLKSKAGKNTKAIIINSPSNPTGVLFSEAVLSKIAEICIENDIFIISDEIYEKIIYMEKKHISIASLSPEVKKRCVVINGVSKTYAMTGWRLGYLASDNVELVKAVGKIQSHSTSNPVSFVQSAAIEALNTPEKITRAMVEEFDRRRVYMLDRVKNIKGLSCVEPQGAFYLFPDFNGLVGKKIKGIEISGSGPLAEMLLTEAKVAVVPGMAFGRDDSFRLSYAASMDDIKKGMDRITELLNLTEG